MNKLLKSLKWFLLSGLILSILACQALASVISTPEPVQTAAVIEATSPPVSMPTEPPAQLPISASQASIEIAGFQFHILKTASESSVMGMKPASMQPDQQVLFIEIELLSGDREAFKALNLVLENAAGAGSDPIALIFDGQISTLADLTFTGDSTSYQSAPENITWAFVAEISAQELYLVFPGGERVDLSSLLQ